MSEANIDEIVWSWKILPHQLKDKILCFASIDYNEKTKKYTTNNFLMRYASLSGQCAGHIYGQGVMHHPMPKYDIRSVHRINRFIQLFETTHKTDDDVTEMISIIEYFFDYRLYTSIEKVINMFFLKGIITEILLYIPKRYEIIYYVMGIASTFDCRFNGCINNSSLSLDEVWKIGLIVSGNINIYSCTNIQDQFIDVICALNPKEFIHYYKLIDWALSGIRGVYIENIFIRHSSTLLRKGYIDVYKLLRQHPDIVNTKNVKVLKMIV